MTTPEILSGFMSIYHFTAIKTLIEKCNDLFVFVPYKEFPLYCEHVNYYDEFYYDDLNVANKKIFNVCYKAKLPLISILKKLLRFRLSVNVNFSIDRIMFHFKRASNSEIKTTNATK